MSSRTFSDVTANHTITAARSHNSVHEHHFAGRQRLRLSRPTADGGEFRREPNVHHNPRHRLSVASVQWTAPRSARSAAIPSVTSPPTTRSRSPSLATHSCFGQPGSDGAIFPDGSWMVKFGGSQTFTMTPDTGYQIAGVTVDGSSVGAVASYTFSSVTATHTIAATFATNTYTVSASAGAAALYPRRWSDGQFRRESDVRPSPPPPATILPA